MNKKHHPQNRAERLNLKKKKDLLVTSAGSSHVKRRARIEALEKEADDELHEELLKQEEKA